MTAQTIRLGIEASNLRRGGGITHLREILRAVDPGQFGFGEVTVWGGEKMLASLPSDRPWLRLVPLASSDSSAARRLWWQTASLSRHARRECDLLFVPGGSYAGTFRPFVTMSQNMLPFDHRERARYGSGPMFWKLAVLERIQSASMRRADGVIFLNDYARAAITRALGGVRGAVAVVPHGVDDAFRHQPRPQRPIESYTVENPFRLLYVSIIDLYKHQWNVAEAVARLRQDGLPVAVEFRGPSTPAAIERFEEALNRLDPAGAFLRYGGATPYADLPAVYAEADGFVFASTCENMPNILLEAMAAGLPIASSNRAAMPDMLGDAGVYFDPENVEEMTASLRRLITDSQWRTSAAAAAYQRAAGFSWTRCANETFAFLQNVARSHREMS